MNLDNEHDYRWHHGLRTPREEIAFTARPKIQSQSQIFRYGGNIFCLPHRPNFSEIFEICLRWVSIVRALAYAIWSDFFPPNQDFLKIVSLECDMPKLGCKMGWPRLARWRKRSIRIWSIRFYCLNRPLCPVLYKFGL